MKEEAARALRRSDIDKLLELIEVLPSDLRAVEQMGLSSDRVSTVLRAFYASLFSTVTSQFERLQDPALREVMRSGIAEQVADAHAKVSLLHSCCFVLKSIPIVRMYLPFRLFFCRLFRRFIALFPKKAMVMISPFYHTRWKKCAYC